MNRKEAYKTLIIPSIKPSEELIGYFQAMYRPAMWKVLLLGALAVFSNKIYYVGVTSRGVYFYKLTFMGKLSSTKYYKWDEIKKIKIKKGVFQKPYYFSFTDGKKLRIQALLKGSAIKVALLNTQTKQFLETKMKEGRQY